MTPRTVALLSAGLLGLSAAPAVAQDWEYGVPPLPPLEEPYDTYGSDDAGYEDSDYGDAPVADDQESWQRDEEYDRRDLGNLDHRGHTRRFAYSESERTAWLDRCRSQQVYDDDRRAALGGTLGAIGGGVIGNRIAGRGNRLEGTVIGAGAGALAGALVGDALDDRADRGRAVDYCEDYLIRYEDSYAAYQPGAHGAYFPGPVMWVRVPIIRERSGCGCEEVEEWIEEEVRAPAPRARRVMPRPDKRVRYSK